MSEKLSTIISVARKAEYKAAYDRLMARAVERDYISGVHERHHITPRSLGGSNDKSNIAVLTYREHFLAHWLLTKFIDEHGLKKMLYALWKITHKSSDNLGRIVSGWQYELSRKSHLSAVIGNQYAKGHKPTEERIETLRKEMLGKQIALGNRFKYTDEQRFARSIRMIGNQNGKGNKGNVLTIERKLEIGASCRGSKSVNAKPIICVNDNRIFGSMSEAAEYYGVQWQSISRICRGVRKSTKGLVFKYFKDVA